MKAILQVGYTQGHAFQTALEPSAAYAIPVPDPKKQQVRVKIAYGATNPIDVKFLHGDYKNLLKQTFPSPIGRDFSGWVDFIPEGCPNPNGFKPGDRVCGFMDHENLSQGSFAEYAVCPIKILAAVPAEVPLQQAAGLPLHGITTYVALVETLKLAPGCGKKLLVLGGSSATGMLAIQLGDLYGCHVACTSTNADLCHSLGAATVIDYRNQNWWEVLQGQDFDYVYDTVGGPESYELSTFVLKRKGLFYTIVGDQTSGEITMGGMIGALCSMCCRGCCGGVTYKMGMNLPSDADRGVTFWLGLMKEGKVKVRVDTLLPLSLETAVTLLDKQASGHSKGKLVVEVCPE
jgi:NADPH:quinone reductase-like Zn-dependent oxidoreductase